MYSEKFNKIRKIVLSNIKTEADEGEYIINYNSVTKYGWEFFDNAVIDCLRLLDALNVKKVLIAGFDGFKNKYNESYADSSLPTLNPDNRWDELNQNIIAMFLNYKKTTASDIEIEFITDSIFNIDV